MYTNTTTSVPTVNGWTQLHSISVPNGTYIVTGDIEYAGTISSRIVLGLGSYFTNNQVGHNGINGGYTIRNSSIVTVTGGVIALGCYCASVFTPDKAILTAVRLK